MRGKKRRVLFVGICFFLDCVNAGCAYSTRIGKFTPVY